MQRRRRRIPRRLVLNPVPEKRGCDTAFSVAGKYYSAACCEGGTERGDEAVDVEEGHDDGGAVRGGEGVVGGDVGDGAGDVGVV